MMQVDAKWQNYFLYSHSNHFSCVFFLFLFFFCFHLVVDSVPFFTTLTQSVYILYFVYCLDHGLCPRYSHYILRSVHGISECRICSTKWKYAFHAKKNRKSFFIHSLWRWFNIRVCRFIIISFKIKRKSNSKLFWMKNPKPNSTKAKAKAQSNWNDLGFGTF